MTEASSQSFRTFKSVSGFQLLNSTARTGTDPRMLVLLRCVLAMAAFAIVAAPAEPRALTATYGPMALYFGFSMVIAYIWYRRDWPVTPRVFHWIDLSFYTYLTAMVGSAESFFFMFFFYPILVASFCWGFREGVMVTLVSTVLFATVGLVEGSVGYGRVLIPATGLMLFGYVISYLGVYEHELSSRLALLKEINSPRNPRFGVDFVNSVNLDRLVSFYGASSCVLILQSRDTPSSFVMYTASPASPARSELPKDVPKKVVDAVMRIPDTLGAYYHDPEGPWWMRYRGYFAYDFDLGTATKSFEQDIATWSDLLDTKAFVTVPYVHDCTTGRMFLTMRDGWFTHADVDFLAQAADAMATVVENIYLVEDFVAGAAESERRAMSRDLHDATIQPYIGLKLALDGLYREAGERNPIAPRIKDLIEMSDSTIRDLRNYAATLKDNAPMPSDFLVDAIAKQADRLRRFYGIDVKVKSEISAELKGGVAAVVFHIVSEGLSNVLRHTSARSAFVNMRTENFKLVVMIGNEVPAANGHVAAFLPRSITERVRALGGETTVENLSDSTVVRVSIPIQ